jgi:hypothetical protein
MLALALLMWLGGALCIARIGWITRAHLGKAPANMFFTMACVCWALMLQLILRHFR